MSPEQTIIVAQMCQDYKKTDTLNYSADYINQYISCKCCAHWQAGRCKKAQNILKSIY